MNSMTSKQVSLHQYPRSFAFTGMSLTALFLTICLSLLFTRGYAQKTPDTIPDFTFYKLDGSAFTKGQLQKGGPAIFILFDCGCEHCQRELVDIGNHFSDFKNVSFYLVTLDRKEEIEKFMNSFGRNLNGKSNVTLLQDKNMQFIPRFKPLRYPGIFIYSAAGKYIFSNSGSTPLKDILNALSKG